MLSHKSLLDGGIYSSHPLKIPHVVELSTFTCAIYVLSRSLMVVTPAFYLHVVYICSLKVTHGGNSRLLPTSGVYICSLRVTHGGKTPDFYIYGKKNLSRSLMVAKLPTFIDIHMFSQGHSWWQNSRLLYMVKKTILSRSLMVAKLPTFIYGKKKQFSQGHSWWQNSRLSLKVTHGGKKLPTFIFGIYIYMFSQNWYTTNEKEHIAHHIKHFEVSPKKQGKLRTKFVRSFQKHWKNHTKFIRNFFEISNGHLF